MRCAKGNDLSSDADNAKAAWTLNPNDDRLGTNAIKARTLLENHTVNCDQCKKCWYAPDRMDDRQPAIVVGFDGSTEVIIALADGTELHVPPSKLSRV